MSAMAKEVRALLEEISAQGFKWKLVNGGGVRIESPAGEVYTFKAHGVAGRRLQNNRAQLRRMGAHL